MRYEVWSIVNNGQLWSKSPKLHTTSVFTFTFHYQLKYSKHKWQINFHFQCMVNKDHFFSESGMAFSWIWFYEYKDKDNQNATNVWTIPFPRHCFLLRCCLWQLLEYIITCNSCRIFALMCFREWYIAHFLFAILPLAPHQRRTNNHRLSEHFFSFSSNFFPISSWTSLSFVLISKFFLSITSNDICQQKQNNIVRREFSLSVTAMVWGSREWTTDNIWSPLCVRVLLNWFTKNIFCLKCVTKKLKRWAC